ncbi:MAG: hypothetical protein IPP45_14370 [Sphingomonadales bacterium]|nr:hypothetical protein [Sphingomonadales bacterium]
MKPPENISYRLGTGDRLLFCRAPPRNDNPSVALRARRAGSTCVLTTQRPIQMNPAAPVTMKAARQPAIAAKESPPSAGDDIAQIGRC